MILLAIVTALLALAAVLLLVDVLDLRARVREAERAIELARLEERDAFWDGWWNYDRIRAVVEQAGWDLYSLPTTAVQLLAEIDDLPSNNCPSADPVELDLNVDTTALVAALNQITESGAPIDDGSDAIDLRATGLLWLINRQVFHPRGFALAAIVEANGYVSGWKVLGDGIEPWNFEDGSESGFLADTEALFASRREQAS